jgi:hypothetical protein
MSVLKVNEELRGITKREMYLLVTGRNMKRRYGFPGITNKVFEIYQGKFTGLSLL